MLATLSQLSQILVLSTLEPPELAPLQPQTRVMHYDVGAMVMQEGDRLDPQLYALIAGRIRISKVAATGKETILRTLTPGEIFAAPALFGNGLAPATVTAETACEVVAIAREALLDLIRTHPEVALKMLSVFNQRLQQLHDTVHGLVSERAIVRLIKYLQYFAQHQGVENTDKGDRLTTQHSYYQIARSIGITYEECVRLFKQLRGTVSYGRGGEIIVQDWQKLDAIAMEIETD